MSREGGLILFFDLRLRVSAPLRLLYFISTQRRGDAKNPIIQINGDKGWDEWHRLIDPQTHTPFFSIHGCRGCGARGDRVRFFAHSQ